MAAFNPIEFGYDVTLVGEEEKTSILNIAGQNKEFAGGINKDDITCAICHLILREPVQAVKCGHRFCGKCIGKFHETNPGKCPMDWQIIQVFPDIGKKREILSLRIRCKNFNEGCLWENEIREQKHHLKTCGYERISCQLKCGEGILRKNMTRHLDGECRMILLCEFKKYGCPYKGTRSSLDDHNEKSKYQHLSLEMKHEILKLKNEFDRKSRTAENSVQTLTVDLKKAVGKITELTKENKEMKEVVTDIKARDRIEESFKNLNRKLAKRNQLTFEILTTPRCPFVWKIENFKTQFEDAKKTNEIINYSPDFFTEKGYKGRLKIRLNGFGVGKNTHVSVHFRNLKGPYDDLLPWPIPWASFTIDLLVNDKEFKKHPYTSTNNGGKWKDNFIRPTGDEGKDLGFAKTFEHKLVENVTDNDTVAIKYEMEF